MRSPFACCAPLGELRNHKISDKITGCQVDILLVWFSQEKTALTTTSDHAEVMEQQQSSPLMTLEEAAAFLRISLAQSYRLAKKGEIPAFKVGASWRVSRLQLEALSHVEM